MTVRPFFFTDVWRSDHIVTFIGAFADTRQSFEARVALVSNFPDSIRIKQSCVVLPYGDRYYVVEVHKYTHVNSERRISVDPSLFVPGPIYQVMCGLIATIL